MPTSLSGRHFLRLLDFTTEEIEYLLKLSREFKNLKLTGTPHRYLEGKNIVLLFQKTSTRTRCAFEVGCTERYARTIARQIKELLSNPSG